MTAASSPSSPPSLDARAAARLAALPGPAPWLHEEVARRMAERLPWITLPVKRWAHWSPRHGGMQGHALVAAHFAQAECVGVPAGESPAGDAPLPWWRPARWARPALRTVAQPEAGSVQMVWANMLLHRVAEPQALMRQWLQALAVDGFVMFSCLGPDTLRGLRALYARLGWPAPAHEFTDMHDWGDMLMQAGFAEPVMFMEHVTLTFETPQRALQELRALGRNLSRSRFAALRGRRWRARLLAEMESLRGNSAESGAESGSIPLEFELIYGHALKPAPRATVSAETVIGLDAMRQALRQPRPHSLPPENRAE